MIEILQQSWPWYISGPLISLVMFLMIYQGKSFGVSSSFKHMCAALGAGKNSSFFNYNWKSEVWNLLFVAGAILGGVIAHSFLSNSDNVINISQETVADLQSLGINDFSGLMPSSVFEISALGNFRNWFILIIGGFLIGFGTRYAGGCTSGHAISGLSNLQLPSLVAVIGFFIGGLLMTYILLPIILKL